MLAIAGGVFLLHELSAGAPLNFAPVPVWPGLFRCGELHRERLRPPFLFAAASNYKLRFSLSSRKMIFRFGFVFGADLSI